MNHLIAKYKRFKEAGYSRVEIKEMVDSENGLSETQKQFIIQTVYDMTGKTIVMMKDLKAGDVFEVSGVRYRVHSKVNDVLTYHFCNSGKKKTVGASSQARVILIKKDDGKAEKKSL